MQLTVWYTAVLLIGLALFSVFSWLALRYAISDSKNTTLYRREQRLLALLSGMPRQWNIGAGIIEAGRWIERGTRAAPEPELIEVRSEDGRRIYPVASDRSQFATSSGKSCRKPCFGQAVLAGRRCETMEHLVQVQDRRYRLLIAATMDEHLEILQRYTRALMWLFPVLCTFSIAGGYALSRRALGPVDRMTSETAEISAHNLSARLMVPQTGDELQRLAETWNALLSRLEIAVERLKQFTADASHDLRTSITVMLTTSELALRGDFSDAEYREAMESISGECRRTAGLLDDLLTLARADASEVAVLQEVTDLAAIVAGSCQRFEPVARAKEQQLTLQLETGPVPILGDDALLMRLVAILLDNAVKYTPAGGLVQVELELERKGAVLLIRDGGPGIPAGDRKRIFDRFYRGDPARRRADGGTGLGLAIAKWIANAHHATIGVESQPGLGSVFRVLFPLIKASSGRVDIDANWGRE